MRPKPIPKIVTDNAACFGHNTDAEFYRDAESSKNAKECIPLNPDHICFSCPVMLECREHGLHNEYYGTWGGMTEYELFHMRKRLRIPQPPSGLGVITMKGNPV